MTDLAWHAGLPNPMDFQIQPINHVVADESPYTFATEVMRRAHQWHVIMTFNHITHEDGWRLMAHFNRSRGGLNVFQIPIFSYRDRLGTKAGTPNLNGAHAAGATSLTITSGSGAFSDGDWFWLTENGIRYAYQVVNDESAGVIEIEPGLRSARASGTALGVLTSGLIYDTMKLTAAPDYPASMPSPLPGFFQPFTVELVTAIFRTA